MFNCLVAIRSSLSAGTGGTGCAKSFLNQRVRKGCLFKKYISKCLEYEIGVVRLAPVNPSVDIRRAPWRRVTMPSRSVMLVTCALAVQWSIKFWWKYFYSSCLVLSHQWSTVENISTMMTMQWNRTWEFWHQINLWLHNSSNTPFLPFSVIEWRLN